MTSEEVFQAFEASGLFSAKNEEPYFSWRRCEACNGLAGDRYAVEGYLDLKSAKKGPGELYTLEVCPDCLYAMNYGEDNR